MKLYVNLPDIYGCAESALEREQESSASSFGYAVPLSCTIRIGSGSTSSIKHLPDSPKKHFIFQRGRSRGRGEEKFASSHGSIFFPVRAIIDVALKP